MKKKGFLESIRMPSPCDADWDAMVGGDAKRFCQSCGKDVYNLSAMKRSSARRLVAGNSGKVCIRLQRATDGRVVTASPNPRSSHRVSLVMAGVVASTLAFTQIAVRGEQRPALEIVREVNPKTCQISFTILDPRDEPIAGATVQLINSQANYSTHTDSKGLAVFDRVEAGRYKITAAAQGFHAYTMSEMSIERPIEPNIRVVLTVGTFVGVVDISDSDLPLFQSIRQGNSESIINAIKGGFGVNTLDSRRRTALHYAAEVGNLELVRFLVNKGADVNAKDKEKLSPIVLIGGDDEDESRDILQILLDHGADVNATDEDGDTLLMRACDDDNVDVVKVLLGHRAKVNLKNPDGETALDKTTSEEVRQLLIGAGAKSDKATNQKPRRI